MAAIVKIKRIYDDAESGDGYRILVDRLWPRGVSKERAALDLWLKEVAPSSELRVWFDHREDRFKEFEKRYEEELKKNVATMELEKLIHKESTVTLLYGAKDPRINHAIVLQNYLHSL